MALVVYVGRGDAKARLLAHAKDPVKGQYEGIILANNNISYAEARGLEQLLIDHYGGTSNLLNIKNGIGALNVKRSEYLQAGAPLLKELVEIIGGS